MKDSFKVIVLVAILAAAVFLEHNLINLSKTVNPSTADKSQESNQEIAAILKIDFGNGKISNYDGVKLKEEKTVFDLLKKVAVENNLELSFKEYPGSGVFIESIDRMVNDAKNNKWWQYWVNEEYATVGASNYQLKNGDLVEWKYVKGQF